MRNYQLLEQRFARIAKLNHLISIAEWDEQVFMPQNSGNVRGEALAEAGLIAQEMLLDNQTADLLALAAEESLDEWQHANLRMMQKHYFNATAIPAELNHAHTLAVMKSTQAWRELRAKNDWANYQPYLAEVVNLTRQQAAARAEKLSVSPYDALLDRYQEGVNITLLENIFGDLKSWLPQLIQDATAQQARIIVQDEAISVEKQKALCLELMKDLGFDFTRGRLDVSHHPFCGGVSSDVRITTRYSTSNVLQSLMSVIHETGHARYEQGLPGAWGFQPVGASAGMMIHESQSLLFEMQIARSVPFIQHLSARIQHSFGNFPSYQAAELEKVFHRVAPGLIRVEADEVTYPAHILLRYEIERGLIEGQFKLRDLPELWNNKMEHYLGITTLGNDKDGCMQDVHWPSGAFGYFPCYTLGAMAAAQLYQRLQQQYPELERDLVKGDIHVVSEWLEHNLWSRASSVEPLTLLSQACGAEFSGQAFANHLRKRYLKSR